MIDSPGAARDTEAVPRLIAYVLNEQHEEGWVIEPGSARREWMDQTTHKAALRCLPLVMANQAGWMVLCPATFKAVWKDRSSDPASLVITFTNADDEKYKGAIRTNFGSGVITFVLPWLFRTPPGIGLWVHGPANNPKADVDALEGLVETDWSPYTFTMNWKITRPKAEVWFRKGEPICMLTPYPLALLESLEPRVLPLVSNRNLFENYMESVTRRVKTNYAAEHEFEFELNYTRGFEPLGNPAAEHRTNLRLKPFV